MQNIRHLLALFDYEIKNFNAGKLLIYYKLNRFLFI